MKIIYLNTLDYGGAFTGAFRGFEALTSQGIDAKLITFLNRTNNDKITEIFPSNTKRLQKKLIMSSEVAYYLLHAKDKSQKFVFSPGKFGIDISRHPDVLSADIIHLHWIYQGFLSINGIKKLLSLGKPVVWTLRDHWAITGGCYVPSNCDKFKSVCNNCPLLYHHSRLAFKQQEKKHKLFNSTENLHIIALSKWMQNRIKSSKIFHNLNRITLIPNPINTTFFKPLDKKQIRQKLGLKHDEIYIGFVAFRLEDTNKGFKYLAEALNNLTKKSFKKKINILVIGRPNPSISEIIKLPTTFTGYISNPSIMRDYYNAMDVVIFPSLQETFGNVPLEAMACGTPVVAFPAGAVPEMIIHKKNGYIAKYKDAADLANGIIDCLENKKVYGKTAREHIVQNFSYPVVGKKLLEFYKSIL